MTIYFSQKPILSVVLIITIKANITYVYQTPERFIVLKKSRENLLNLFSPNL